MIWRTALVTGVACLATAAGARDVLAQDAGARERVPVPTAAVRTVEQFHAALEAGDSSTVAALLDTSAVVLESGEYETRSDYLRHHLPADIAFARAVPSVRRVRHVTERGNAAWVASTTHAAGSFNGRAVDSEGAELMVLAKTPSGWRIMAIHWSSHRRAP